MNPILKSVLVFVLFIMFPLFVIASWYTCQEGNWILTYACSAVSIITTGLGYNVMNRK